MSWLFPNDKDTKEYETIALKKAINYLYGLILDEERRAGRTDLTERRFYFSRIIAIAKCSPEYGTKYLHNWCEQQKIKINQDEKGFYFLVSI